MNKYFCITKIYTVKVKNQMQKKMDAFLEDELLLLLLLRRRRKRRYLRRALRPVEKVAILSSLIY